MSNQPDQQQSVPLVSIVLPVFNGEGQLGKIFGELERQSYANWELIVVDDGSTDGTREKAVEVAKGMRNARVVGSEHAGASHARNLGVLESRGEVVFFAETDCVYERDFLKKAIDSLRESRDASAVCLTGAPLKLRSTIATECIEIENRIQHKLLETGKIKPFYAWVYRKSALEKIGGFDETLFQGEDKDLFQRLQKAGMEVAWVPGVNWRHQRDQTLGELARKWYGRGQSRILYVIKHRLVTDALKTTLPLYFTLLSLPLFFVSPLATGILLLIVLLSFIFRTFSVLLMGWSVVEKKRYFVYYPLFLLTRNFSSGAGYTLGLLKTFLGMKVNP